MNKAIVFNTFFNGLGVIRALGKNNIDIIALDKTKNTVGKYSKYTDEFYKVTDPNIDDEKFINDLIDIGKNYSEKPVLFPTNDSWSIAISKYKEKIEKYFLTYNPDYSVMEKIINKKKFYKIMTKENILVPQTYEVEDYEHLKKIKNKLKYPIIMKPNSRMDVNRKSKETKIYNSNRIIEINKFEDFKEYKDLIDNYDFLIQQKIPGLSNRMFTIGVYADRNSDVRAVFSGRKVRGFPVDIGDCFAGESLWVEELVEKSKKIIKLLGYTGIAEIEYKYNYLDGKYYLIEINPRTWSWVGITPEAGVNLPLIAYKDMVGEKIPDYLEMNKEKKVLWTRSIDDRYNCKNNHKNINDKDFLKSEKEWEESLKKYDRVVYADLDPDDIKPGLFWKKGKKWNYLKTPIKKVYKAIFRRHDFF